MCAQLMWAIEPFDVLQTCWFRSGQWWNYPSGSTHPSTHPSCFGEWVLRTLLAFFSSGVEARREDPPPRVDPSSWMAPAATLLGGTQSAGGLPAQGSRVFVCVRARVCSSPELQAWPGFWAFALVGERGLVQRHLVTSKMLSNTRLL